MKALVICLQLGLLLSCAKESKFAGGASSATEGQSPSNAEAESPIAPSFDTLSSAAGVADCVEGDKLLIPWTGPAKACIDQGKTYLFDTKTCAEIRKANFSCDWATLQAKLQEKALLSDTIKNDAANGAKLISCGLSEDGNRFAVQWVKLTEGPALSCAKIQQGGGVTTGCYTHYPDGNSPPAAANDDERRQRVANCLRQL